MQKQYKNLRKKKIIMINLIYIVKVMEKVMITEQK